MEKEKVSVLKKIDYPIFLPPAIILLIFTVVGIVAPDAFSNGASAALAFCTKYFSWFYALGATLLVAFCFWAGFSKYGNIRLGGKDAKPDMPFFTWFAIALTSGIAIGIVYWGVAEPLSNLMSPPGFTGWEAGSADAAEGALKFNFLHWGLHPYGIYTAAGLCCAFIIMNGKRRFSLTSTLYPLLGDKCEGIWGKVVSALCIFAILGGMGTSLGFGVSQFGVGVNYVFGTNFSDAFLAIFFIGVLVICTIGASCSGLHKAITHVSNANMYIYFALMIWAFIFGGTMFILNNTTSAIGQYLAFIIPESFYLEPVKATGWVSGWSIFYWAWWLSFAPIVGLFLIKLAKGRTIRQFVLVNLVAPTIFAIAWFGIFGSSAINFQMNGAAIYDAISEWGSSVALFAYVDNLPLTPVLYALVFLAIIFSLLTLSESMTLTLADMSIKPEYLGDDEVKSSPASIKVFWGILMGAVAFVLLISGGLGALQTSSVVCGLPILLVQLIWAGAYIKSMRQRSRYDLTLSDEEREALQAEEAAQAEEPKKKKRKSNAAVE